MNFGVLRTETYDRMGVSASDGQLGDTVVKRLVNDAKNHLATVHDWPWQEKDPPATFSTVAGTQNYSPPADWLRTIELRVTGPDPFNAMTRYSVTELDDLWPSSLQGLPVAYALPGGKLRLAPSPDGVYTVSHRYIVLEPDLSGDSDTPLAPAQFHPAIAEYAAYLGLRRISEEARANVCLAAWDRWLRIMGQDRQRSTAPMRIRVRPGGFV